MSIKERIEIFIEKQGIRRSAFEKACGFSNGYTRNLKENPSATKIEDILKAYPDLNRVWLLSGEGEMLRPDAKDAGDRAEMLGMPFPASTPEEGVSSVRFFSVTPSASFQDFCCSESERPEYIPVIAPPGEHIDESSCVFEVHGDSMLPQIPDHAKILCREISPSRWHQVYDGVVVIAYADRFVIKRVVKNRLAAEDFIVIMFQARQILSSPIR